MQPWKQSFRRMNLDSDVRSMQPGDYRKLTNGTPVQPASSSYANAAQDIVCNIIGNQLVANSLPSGTNQIIGCVEDRKSNRLFFAAWNNTGSNNSIYQYSASTGAIVLVMRTALFQWAQTDFVDMDIVGDILVFTNNRSDIQKINVAKAIAGGTYTPSAVELTLIKPPPLSSVTWALSYDNNTPTNNIAGNYFQFFYRYVYEDYDYSVFSPASRVSNGWTYPPGTAVNCVATTNQALSGLTAIDGIHSTLDGDRILLIGQTTATENGVWVRHAGAWTRPSDFAAASNSDITVYVLGGLTHYAQVWRVRSANVNTVAPGLTRLEGPNKLTITRVAAIPATVTSIEYAVRVNASNEFIVYRQERAGSFSSTHTFYNNSYLFTVPDADTFVWNDNVPLTTKSLKIFKNRIFLFNNTEGYTHVTTTQVGLSLNSVVSMPVQPTTGDSADKTYVVAKAGGRYNVGVIFFDAYGRHSGVKCDNTITIPEDIAHRYTIAVDLTPIAADVPSWAVRKSIVCTKELTSSFFISHYTQDIYFYKKDNTGAFTYKKTLATFGAEGTLIDIQCLTKDKIGYTFNQGDRIKFYLYDSAGNPYTVDTAILGQEGRFLLTRVLSEFDAGVMVTSQATFLPFEIYTPKTPTQEPFYETGFVDVSSANIYGDVELTNRLNYSTVSGAYSATNPYANDYGPTDSYLRQMESMSIWDNNFPLWVTQAGRPMIKSDSRQINKYTYIRWGQQFILNANFLGLNTFYALDEQAMPVENGAGTRLAEAGEILVAVHEVETEAVYVGQGFVKIDQGTNQFLTKTDGVVGDVRRYLGGNGSLHPASVVSRNGNVYFFDMRKGMIVRRAQDGLTRISENGIEGLISTLSNTHVALATSRIIAGWDPQYKSYCISFIDTSGPSGNTLYFHEKSNSWIFQSDLRPELFGILGQKQFSFLSGACWIQTMEGNYNKFFGVQYNRILEMELSPLRSLIHIWDAIEIDVENIYSTSGSNEDIVLVYHKNGDTLQTKINYADFKTRESDRVWKSAFFRWINDPNFSNPNAITKSKYGSAKRIRGQSAFMTITYNGTDRNPMKSVTIFYTPSQQSTP